MKISRFHKSLSQSRDTKPETSPFAPRSFGIQTQKTSSAPPSQTEIENQAFAQQKMEATKLEIQAKYGTLTPEGQERLGVLQAKMNGFWVQRREQSQKMPNLLDKPGLFTPRQKIAPAIQPQLTIGKPGDKYEQEADRVAADVVSRMHQPQNQKVQRQEREEELQMQPMIQQLPSEGGMAATADLETSIQQARGGGQPLAQSVREPMEQAFGADFSGVKVHTDAQSDQLNQSIQAKAFTTGKDVFFRQGEYNPESRAGQELIAHELTHVVQQSGQQKQLQKNPEPDPKGFEYVTLQPNSVLTYASGEVETTARQTTFIKFAEQGSVLTLYSKKKKKQLTTDVANVVNRQVEIKEFKDKSSEKLPPDNPTINDVIQGELGDCYLLAALIGLVNHSQDMIKGMFKDEGKNVTVKLYEKKGIGNYTPKHITVAKTVPIKQNNSDAYAQGSLWVQIIEKAYVAGGFTGNQDNRNRLTTAANDTNNYYQSIEAGNAAYALEVLTGKDSSKLELKSVINPGELGDSSGNFPYEKSLFMQIKESLKKAPLLINSKEIDPQQPNVKRAKNGELVNQNGIIGNHVYAIISTRNIGSDQNYDKNYEVQLRDPYGKEIWLTVRDIIENFKDLKNIQ